MHVKTSQTGGIKHLVEFLGHDVKIEYVIMTLHTVDQDIVRSTHLRPNVECVNRAPSTGSIQANIKAEAKASHKRTQTHTNTHKHGHIFLNSLP
jgi:hypothetical protein